MILKLFADGQWYYYDNIVSLKKENVIVNTDKDLSSVKVINAPNFSDTVFILHEYKPNVEIKCRRVTYKKNDGTTGVVVFNSYCYILNDDGKTIDKI